MALISSVYNNNNIVQIDTNPMKGKKQKLTNKQKGISKNTNKKVYKKSLPVCKCAVCDEHKHTKRLGKADRDKYKSKLHPICNECRDRLIKLGVYQSILGTILFKINHEYMDGDTEYQPEPLPNDYYDNM